MDITAKICSLSFQFHYQLQFASKPHAQASQHSATVATSSLPPYVTYMFVQYFALQTMPTSIISVCIMLSKIVPSWLLCNVLYKYYAPILSL